MFGTIIVSFSLLVENALDWPSLQKEGNMLASHYSIKLSSESMVKSHAISKNEIGSYYPVTETSLLNLNLILKPTETYLIVEPSKNGTHCLAMF